MSLDHPARRWAHPVFNQMSGAYIRQLGDLLRMVKRGELLIPDYQRGRVWSPLPPLRGVVVVPPSQTNRSSVPWFLRENAMRSPSPLNAGEFSDMALGKVTLISPEATFHT